MRELTVTGSAKINLSLDVLRRREDGYHEVRMVMQTIDVRDTLILRKCGAAGEIRLTVDVPGLEADERNLAYRAAKILFDDCQARGVELSEGVTIELHKHIPMAAGLAGGSADCAAVLRGVNELFEMGYTMEELQALGVKLGADVPYCVMEGTALAEGIGEKLTKLPDCPMCYVLIAKPPVDVPTKFVYGNLRVNERPAEAHPHVDSQLAAIQAGDIHEVARTMGNILETVTIPEYPVIEQIKNIMKEQGALNAMMSGSGPTVFGLFDSEETMKQAYDKVIESGLSGQTEQAKMCWR